MCVPVPAMKILPVLLVTCASLRIRIHSERQQLQQHHPLPSLSLADVHTKPGPSGRSSCFSSGFSGNSSRACRLEVALLGDFLWGQYEIELEVKPNGSKMDFRSPGMIVKVCVAALAVGGIMGMMGAGGAMTLKPVLYYVFAVKPFKFTIYVAYIILVALSFVGTLRGQVSGHVRWKDVAFLVVFTSGIGTAIGAFFASLASSKTQLLLFAILMINVASYMMMQSWKPPPPRSLEDPPKTLQSFASCKKLSMAEISTLAVAIGIGALCGFLGVGGGFILTPLLCYFGHEMDTAIPTSQAVICISCTCGILWYILWNKFDHLEVPVILVMTFIAVGTLGLLCSEYIGEMLSQTVRQRVFALLLLLTGLSIIVVSEFSATT
eukprot:gnl/TRDRNA2_/TRDRNA2_201661_c0_seq2.p1 gnl/TRDRNA2_/TRDRNA2_201661_c0~~gnl/TRDRNA2_/TRDRNA2_201661_c0_seq2.p1  ORF type:complete len:379 (-),score=31.68 gnl/TRDRNA2_/TRDRNA2_201661_c0_seq2:33-1169(-)